MRKKSESTISKISGYETTTFLILPIIYLTFKQAYDKLKQVLICFIIMGVYYEKQFIYYPPPRTVGQYFYIVYYAEMLGG